MLTTTNLITFLQLREGFRKHAYDDKNPNRELTADTEIEGTLTIGYGTTRYPDGRAVKWDDTVTKTEATEYLEHYVKANVEPTLENLIHRPLASCQYDALGSCIYQYGAQEVSGWRLIRLINGDAHWRDIIAEWVRGTVMFMGEPLFWGRRVQEVFMFLGLDWRAGQNVAPLTDLAEAAEVMGFDGEMPKPEGWRANMHEDPTPDTPMTLEDAQYLSAAAAGYEGSFADFAGHRTMVSAKNTIAAPNVDASREPKAMEDSKTHRGLAKRQVGKEAATVGGVTTAAVSAASAAQALSGSTSATVENVQSIGISIEQFIFIGLLIGVPLAVYGLWKMYMGGRIAREGRLEGTQLKV